MQVEDRAIISTFIDYFSTLKLNERSQDVVLKHNQNAELIITGIENPLYNSVMLDTPTDCEALAQELLDLRRKIELPMTVWLSAISDTPEMRASLESKATSPGAFYGMLLEVNTARLLPSNDSVVIELVQDERQAKIFSEIFAETFNLANVKDAMYELILKQFELSEPNNFNYLAKVGGSYVGTSSLIIDKSFKPFKTGGFYNACVLPEFRTLGIGTAMAQHRLHEALALGIEYLSIVLMSDAMARGYCEKMGFKNYSPLTPYFIV